MEKLIIKEIDDIITTLTDIKNTLKPHVGGLKWCDISLLKLDIISGKLSGIKTVFAKKMKERKTTR